MFICRSKLNEPQPQQTAEQEESPETPSIFRSLLRSLAAPRVFFGSVFDFIEDY